MPELADIFEQQVPASYGSPIGEPALIGWRGDAPFSITWIDADASTIHNLYRLLNPDKLACIGAKPPPQLPRFSGAVIGDVAKSVLPIK
jgi:hypothetical protein